MTLEALGNIGEAAGAIAVVVSLVYLITQMRQNTLSIRSATYQSVVGTAAGCNQILTQNKELARIFRVGGENLSELDDDERLQFSFLCMQFFDIFENLYLQYLHGTIDTDYWLPRQRSYLALFSKPGFADRWAECRPNYTEKFGRLIDEGLASIQSDPNAEGVDFLFGQTAPDRSRV